MGENELSQQSIQNLLNQNSFLIKSILKLQKEGRTMDAMIYKTRLQMNLEKLVAIAESKSENSNMIIESDLAVSSEQQLNTQVQLSKFVRTVKENGLKSLSLVSDISGIPLEKIGPLAQAYISFLKRQNRFTEAQQLESELVINGVEESV